MELVDDEGNVIESKPHNCDDHAPGHGDHDHADSNPLHEIGEEHQEGYGCCPYVPSTMANLCRVNKVRNFLVFFVGASFINLECMLN